MRDTPDLRFKVAACMYALGQGGGIKVLADVASIGESTLRKYLHLFADATIAQLKLGEYRNRLYGGSQSISKSRREIDRAVSVNFYFGTRNRPSSQCLDFYFGTRNRPSRVINKDVHVAAPCIYIYMYCTLYLA